MATENKGKCISLTATATLASSQFMFVKLGTTATNCVVCTGLTDRPIGIVQNAPIAGQPAEVMVSGVSKLVCGGSVALGALVGSDSAAKGTAITVAAGGTVYNYAGGLVLTGNTAANGVAEVLVFSGGQPLLV